MSFNPVFVVFRLDQSAAGHAVRRVEQGQRELRAILEQDGVTLRDYSEVAEALRAVPSGAGLLVDPARVTAGLLDNLDSGVKLIEGLNPTTLAKSQKSLADAEHIRQAMEQDGAALCEFFAWLGLGAAGGERITELTIDEHLTAARERRPAYVSLSFNTIAAFNANGAMPHYHATEEEHAVIEGDGLLLIDSGGQYLGGTTDITRMVPVGTPTDEQQRDCTRVLKGVIALVPRAVPARHPVAAARRHRPCADLGRKRRLRSRHRSRRRLFPQCSRRSASHRLSGRSLHRKPRCSPA